jgi:hypothetical protein
VTLCVVPPVPEAGAIEYPAMREPANPAGSVYEYVVVFATDDVLDGPSEGCVVGESIGRRRGRFNVADFSEILAYISACVRIHICPIKVLDAL